MEVCHSESMGKSILNCDDKEERNEHGKQPRGKKPVAATAAAILGQPTSKPKPVTAGRRIKPEWAEVLPATCWNCASSCSTR